MMIDILEGRIERAKNYAYKLLKEDPNDLESLFILSLIYANSGDLKAAVRYASDALKRGLPVTRFYSGPRDLLTPLINDLKFLKLIKTPLPEIVHGPMLGGVTQTSARIWVRTRKAAKVRVKFSTSGYFTKSAFSDTVPTKNIPTGKTSDHIGVVFLQKLKPNTTYYYDVLIDGKSQFKDRPLSFKTFSVKKTFSDYQIVFGGCAGYAPSKERIWDTILQGRPDAMLLLGDNVYISFPGAPSALHDYIYARRQSRPEFRRLVGRTSVHAIWDDHDAGADDLWFGPYRDRPSWKQPMVQHFSKNWNNGKTGTEQWPGHWHKFTIGEIEVFMLDGRTYRTNPYAPNPTMLGKVQKKWLLDGLKNSKATFKIIASPIPWSDKAKKGTRDIWAGFPKEREDIFGTIIKHKIDGVILLSSDRHRADVWKLNNPGGYPLYDFTSGLLTNEVIESPAKDAVFTYTEKQNFGRILAVQHKGEPALKVQFVSIDNEVVYEKMIKLSEVSFKGITGSTRDSTSGQK